MNNNEFRKHGHDLVDWMADFFEHVDKLPVKSKVKPREIFNQIPDEAPDQPEHFDSLMTDFNNIILPGMTHWQHTGWHAYFTANNSYPSILAEMLTSTLGAQCMSWLTSPAATELEEKVMNWTAKMIGLPDNFEGVIQDTASTATLVSLLTAREKVSGLGINEDGFYDRGPYTIYCSTEAHSSIERAVKIAGFGKEYLRKVRVNSEFAMVPEELEKAVVKDIQNGYEPLAVVAAIGTTGSTAVDPLKPISKICKKHNLWLHVDAAWAGTALLLPEMRWMIEGIEQVDSFVFNPHKWMFTNFDCSAYFVKDKGALIQTFEILPEYLKTKEGSTVNNYRDWGIQLGRRFRALKFWFVIRSFGVKGLQEKVGNHILWANQFADWIKEDNDFELLAPHPLATVCFRLHPSNIDDEEKLNALNASFLEEINNSEKIFLTHTKLNEKYTLRFVVGQTRTEFYHIDKAWKIICDAAQNIKEY